MPLTAEQIARLPDCGAFEVNFVSSTYVVPWHAVWRGDARRYNHRFPPAT